MPTPVLVQPADDGHGIRLRGGFQGQITLQVNTHPHERSPRVGTPVTVPLGDGSDPLTGSVVAARQVDNDTREITVQVGALPTLPGARVNAQVTTDTGDTAVRELTRYGGRLYPHRHWFTPDPIGLRRWFADRELTHWVLTHPGGQ